MRIADAILPEFDQEAGNTRKTLERVPEDKLGWKPHPKSGTMGWLAGHLANLPIWVPMTLEKDSLDINPPGGGNFRLPEPTTRQELLAMFDTNTAAARASIAATSDEQFMLPWTLLSGGRAIFTLPRVAVLRSFVLNHTVHHRAQLGVYLRLNDIAVPAIYGPSADEGQF